MRAPMLNYAACIFSGLFGGSQSLTGNPAVCTHAYSHTQTRRVTRLQSHAERAKIFQFHSRLRLQESPPVKEESSSGAIPNSE